MRAAAAAGALAPDLPPSSPAQAPCPSEPSCPRTPCWVQNWHSGERPEAWPTEPRSRGRWHRASGLTVPEPGGGCAQLSSSPNFKRQRIIFLSVASKVRWKIKLLKKKAASAARAGERGSSLLPCRSHGKAKETDPSRGGGDERHGDSQVHGVDLRGGERPRGTLKQQRGAEEREGERRPGRRPSLPPACTSQCEDSQK